MSSETNEKGNPTRFRWSPTRLFALVLIIFLAAYAVLPVRWNPFRISLGGYEPLPRSFDGPSTQLKHTQIVPTLDTPVEKGKNVIWCASFSAAWKALQNDLLKDSVQLRDGDAACKLLNNAPDPRPDIPKECFYVKAGRANEGVIEAIHKDVAARFPSKQAPSFPGIRHDSFLAYAYLETHTPFNIPYFENDEALVFTDSLGSQSTLCSFGIRPKDEYAYKRLRTQPHILYEEDRYHDSRVLKYREYAIDLCGGSRPNQVIFAKIELKESLADTVADLNHKIASLGGQSWGLGVRDVLLVPNMHWRIAHRFSELEGRPFSNPSLAGQRMDVALQEIEFRLDRSGAELRTEAKQYCMPIPVFYVGDGPFLLVMRKRGAERPYFVMWMDNAEILQQWNTPANTPKKPTEAVDHKSQEE